MRARQSTANSALKLHISPHIPLHLPLHLFRRRDAEQSLASILEAGGQTTTVTYDDLIDLELSVLSSFRDNGTYMFSDATLATLRKVKDSTGQYLWQPGLQAGAPNQLNGHGYIINNYMPAPAANAKSILFGDFREGFVVRRVRDVQLLRLDERYADFLQAGFLAFNRADSKQQNAQAYKAYRNSAT